MIVFIIALIVLAFVIAYTNYDDAKTYRELLEISRQETRYLSKELQVVREENDLLKAKQKKVRLL